MIGIEFSMGRSPLWGDAVVPTRLANRVFRFFFPTQAQVQADTDRARAWLERVALRHAHHILAAVKLVLLALMLVWLVVQAAAPRLYTDKFLLYSLLSVACFFMIAAEILGHGAMLSRRRWLQEEESRLGSPSNRDVPAHVDEPTAVVPPQVHEVAGRVERASDRHDP